jgi:lipopolysaccharide biosynthesis glycosyltransferase
MHPSPIHIVCGVDANYAPHLGVMLRSLAASNPAHRFHVHVLEDGVPLLLQAQVESCAPTITFEWIRTLGHPALQLVSSLEHISRASFLRLMIAEVIDPTIDRVLYLDVDVIITGDIMPLWQTDLVGHPCAAVPDACISATDFAARHGLSGTPRYFNSGILLLDMKALRRTPYMQQTVTLLANPNIHYPYADQDGLNIVFWNNWLALDPSWNFQRGFLYNDSAAWLALAPTQRPIIIHFTEAAKPWFAKGWQPMRWLYLKHMLRTPFAPAILRAGGYTPFLLARAWLRWVIKRPIPYRLIQ